MLSPDEEDERLNKLQKMRQREVDYTGLTTKVLQMCNEQRQPLLAKRF